jgi:uncharacterized protein (TIGR00297 family)
VSLRRAAAGACFAALIAASAFRAHALTRGGALAACAVGTLTFGAGGWAFTLVLLAFFLPSVALSRVGRARKKRLVDVGKGGARDAWQVLANGGAATLCALVARERGRAPSGPDQREPRVLPLAWVAAFAGSYAAATADTWGTEIGTLARGTPRSILTLRPMPTGLSGGITTAGTAAEIAGAAWIATVAVLTSKRSERGRAMPPTGTTVGAVQRAAATPRFGLAICLGGMAGALVDSVLGATLQELRRCPACERTCETNPHACGEPTVRVRGLSGFSNDGVNAAATLTGAVIAFVLA